MTAAEQEKIVAETLDKLTLEEKINLLHGDFQSGGVERLGIKKLMCADGPLGVRMKHVGGGQQNAEVTQTGLIIVDKPVTALPATLGLAATFNTDTARRYAQLIAREARDIGIHVMFGPGMNLMRDPRCGRNFEYFGEDPILTGKMGVAYIQAMQQCGVGACAKHYYANDLEHRRHQTSSNLDKRTAMELHLRPFASACQQAGVWTIMTGNNLVNGQHISENPAELRSILRDKLGWDGVVLTDWRAAYSPQESVKGGTDMTTGLCHYVYGDDDLPTLVASGKITEAEIDSLAAHVLMLYARVGLLGEIASMCDEPDTAEHSQIAREIAAETFVLLKNDKKILPLQPATVRRILVAGPAATEILSGGGSSAVGDTDKLTTPLEALKQIYSDAEIVLADGNTGIENFDAYIYFAQGPSCGEGFDLTSIALEQAQQDEINSLGQAQGKLVVVLQCGTATDVSGWADSADAILVAWYGGCDLAAALADALSGAVSPSGKLPCTFAKLEQFPCSMQQTWPAKPHNDQPLPEVGFTKQQRRAYYGLEANYTEGRLIGYRWFDSKGVTPQYPFGFGISYTEFSLSDFSVSFDGENLLVKCQVKNTGNVCGAETVQVYVSTDESMPDTPPRELKGFSKVFVAPGDLQQVEICITRDDLKRYDESTGQLGYISDNYEVHVGTSSRDILFSQSMEL